MLETKNLFRPRSVLVTRELIGKKPENYALIEGNTVSDKKKKSYTT